MEAKFASRSEAAEALLEILPKEDLRINKFVIVCLSLSSVVLSDILARNLKLDYEILFSEPIFAPNNLECEIAAVSETKEILINDNLIKSFNITKDFVFGEAERKYEEKILKDIYKYRKGELLENLVGKNILLVDEGCETGATALLAIKTFMKLNAQSIFYATPVIPQDIINNLNNFIDELYYAKKIADFVDVDFYYEDQQANSDELMKILEESPYYLPLQKEINKEKNNAVQSWGQ